MVNGKRKVTKRNVLRQGAGARTQKRQIASLAGQVSKISKQIKEDWNPAQYVVPINTQLATPYTINEISMIPSLRTRIFNQNDAAHNKSWFKVVKMNMDYKLYPANEEGFIDMTLMVVSLHADNAQKVWFETGGVSTLTSGFDYYSQNGRAFINRGRFKIHHVKRCQTFMNETDNTKIVGGFTRGYLNKKVSHKLVSKTGDWDTTIQDTDYPLHHRYFIIAFNNNSGFDGEYPTLQANTLWSGFN